MDLTKHLPPQVARQLARVRRSESRMRWEPTEKNVRYHIGELLVLERLLDEWADGMEEGQR